MNIKTIVRSNQNAVMALTCNKGNSNFDSMYSIFDLSLQTITYSGTLNACKKAWNRHYKNSRQFVSKNGLNHRYLTN